MKSTQSLRKKIVKIVLAIILVVIIFCGAVVASIFYANRSAERRSREFCDEISIGSDISTATVRANSRKILWGHEDRYTFYFPGFIFDKAVCEVTVNQHGKVISKSAEMEYD
jgi:hypothetical protein